VRAEVIIGKGDVIVAAVIMHGEIDEALVAASDDAIVNEGRLEHAVATLAWHVIYAVDGEVKFATEQPHSARALGNTGRDDCAMFVVIAGKEMAMELPVQTIRQYQLPRAIHGRDSSHRSTFNSLSIAVSVEGSW
jgi:hypothetical protein